MRRVFAVTMTCVALPLALSAGLDAQSRFAQPAPQNAQQRFRGMDQNNDGVVTRAEWRGSARSFDQHDWNRDGVLSGDEVRVGAPRVTRRTTDAGFDSAAGFNSWSDADFTAMDRNRDGRILPREWPYDRESFWRLDANGDGMVARTEFLGSADVDDDREDRFAYLDDNNDGRVERREWHGSGVVFERLDRNRDDVLTVAEMNGQGAAAGTTGSVGTSGQIVRVDPKQRWIDTGLDVQAGDRVTFDAEGSIELSTGGNDVATAAGARSGRRAANAPLPQEVAGGLIARIGNSSPLFVGANRVLRRAPVSGRLYLSVNDDHLDDNSGEYRVSVTIDRR